jgi:uncharacterized protein YybS (DUF2232 family)
VEEEKRPYVHGGLAQGMGVLSLALLVVALIPVIGPIVVIFIPLPIIYYYSSLGRSRGLTALAVGFLVASFTLVLLGQAANIFVLFMVVLNGLIFAEILQRRFSLERSFVLASLALFFSGVAVLSASSFLSNVPPWRILGIYIERIIAENVKISEQLNFSGDQISFIRENTQQITAFFTWIFPALALSGSVVTVWVNVLLARPIFARNNVPFPDFGDLSLWKAPEKCVWLLISSGIMTLAPVVVVDMVGLNLLIICCLVYFFQGIAIASFFFNHKKVPVFVRGLIYGLMIVQQYMVVLVIAFGLFDMWIDFRKRITRVKDVPA